MPLVSVIMPVYNGERFLAQAIESILAQSFTDFELLIVDDASTDNSAEIIRSYAARDDRLRMLAHEHNRGQGAAQSTGAAAAAGEFITLMDCDDVSLPQRLELQVGCLRQNGDIGALGACCLAMNGDLSEALFDFIVPPEHALIAFNLFFGASFVGATVMYRAEVLQAVGGFANHRRHSPDLDVSMRLLWRGQTRFANLPDKLLLYRRHGEAKTVAETEKSRIASRQIRAEMLERLWGEAPATTLDLLHRLRMQEGLGWAERRHGKRDLRRLIDSLISHKLVDADDRALLLAAMNQRLEQASPKWRQKFGYWRRYRLPWLSPDRFGLYD